MTKKIIIAIAVFTAVAILIAAGVFMRKHFAGKHMLDGTGMVKPLCFTITSCRYSTGGGMDGGSSFIEVYTGEDDKIYLSYYDCPYIGAEEKSYTIEVGTDAIGELRRAFYSRSFLSWGKLEKSDLIVLDAPQTVISVTYGEGEFYSVSSSDELPEDGDRIFTEIYSILNMFTKGGN